MMDEPVTGREAGWISGRSGCLGQSVRPAYRHVSFIAVWNARDIENRLQFGRDRDERSESASRPMRAPRRTTKLPRSRDIPYTGYRHERAMVVASIPPSGYVQNNRRNGGHGSFTLPRRPPAHQCARKIWYTPVPASPPVHCTNNRVPGCPIPSPPIRPDDQ